MCNFPIKHHIRPLIGRSVSPFVITFCIVRKVTFPMLLSEYLIQLYHSGVINENKNFRNHSQLDFFHYNDEKNLIEEKTGCLPPCDFL